MTYNASALTTRIEALEAELARCKMALAKADLPDEPIFDPGMGPKFITFQKRFGRSSGRFYTYAAVAPYSNRWFITGRRFADFTDQGMSWDRLMEFMVSDETEISRTHVIETFRTLH